MYEADWVHTVRELESRILLDLLRDRGLAGARILEVGAGDGFMARVLGEHGFAVRATDPAPRSPAFVPIEAADGSRLPAEDGSYDVVFSSNVLEHISDLPAALREMQRVLRPGGLLLHAVPTVACNLMTMAAQPFAYLRNLGLIAAGELRPAVAANGPRLAAVGSIGLFAWNHVLPHRLVLGPPHGEGFSRVAALLRWRRARWRRVFEQSRLEVLEVRRLELAFSQHKLFAGRGLGLRRQLGRFAGGVDLYALAVRGEAAPESQHSEREVRQVG